MLLDELFEDHEELYEMANIGSDHTGIPNVIIWVGMDYKRHAMRIKVSNEPNRWSNDYFVITLPTLEVIGHINTRFISGKILNDIKDWIKLNIDTLISYERGDIQLTREFLDLLVSL